MTEVDELIGAELDAAVARIEGYNPTIEGDEVWLYPRESTMPPSYESPTSIAHRFYNVICQQFHPSREWVDGGPIIKRERISLHAFKSCWQANIGTLVTDADPDQPLVAAMRCYVKLKGK